MFENPRKSRQARNFTTNVPKILDLKSSSEQIFCLKLSLGAPAGCTVPLSTWSFRHFKPESFEWKAPEVVWCSLQLLNCEKRRVVNLDSNTAFLVSGKCLVKGKLSRNNGSLWLIVKCGTVTRFCVRASIVLISGLANLFSNAKLAFGEEILFHRSSETWESCYISIEEIFGPFWKF